MRVHSLQLKSFRNYQEETVLFSPNVNVLFGDNAQGKTNLLEAIHLFSSGKSHRSNSDKDMISYEADSAKLILSYENKERSMESELRLFSGRQRKEMKQNGVKINKKKEWIGSFKSVLFYPEELNLVKEGPEGRRHFLDSAIGMLRPMYDHYTVVYQNALRQKSLLLRKIEDYPSYRKMIPVWNEYLAELGSRIVFYRQSFLRKMEPMVKEIVQDITSEKEILDISYDSPFSDFKTVESIKSFFKEKQEEMKETEIRAKQVLIGPHRDDFLLMLNGKSAKSFASQGQQRSIVLALKLAQTRLIFEETGEYPVLLLDDIMSELDSSRRRYLTENTKEKQVIITCTDPEYVELNRDVSYFRVEEGKVFPCTSI